MNINKNYIVLCETENQVNDITIQFLKQNNKPITRLPEIKLISRWLFEKYDEFLLGTELNLLNGIDEKFIWEEIINEDKTFDKIKNQKDINFLCQFSRNTNKSFADYCVPEKEIASIYTEFDSFYTWREKFHKICKERNMVPVYDFMPLFIEIQKQNNIINNQKLHIVGTDSVLPIYQELYKLLSKENEIIKHEAQQTKTIKIKQNKCAKIADEYKAITNWIKTNKANNKNNLLIISPALNSFYYGLENQINRDIQPKIFDSFLEKSVYNTSLRRPLSKEPIVWTIFELIKLNQNKAKPTKLITQLLNFDNWIDKENLRDREKFSHYLSSTKVSKYSVTSLYEILNGNNNKLKNLQLESLKEALNNILRHRSKWNKKQSTKDWVSLTLEFINSINFCKINYLLSFEINNLENFYKALQNIKSNRNFDKKMDFNEYLNKLTFYLEMYNPPPFNPEATIDIYGFDEYPIKDYDAIWLMNLNNNYLPGISQNKTFLPNKIKEKYHINDEEYDKKILNLRIERITKATDDITFSYSEDFDDINLSKTQLPKFLEIEENTIDKDVNNTTLNDGIFEYIDDFNAPPFPRDYSQTKYGRNILNAQLICPAWAFFEYRLGLGANENDLQEEISSLTIGNMVHEILEVFWGEVKSQDNLLKLSNEKILDQKILNIIEKIICKYKSIKPFCSDIHFKIEKTRIIRLISKWLEYEANRKLAFDIFELEKKFSVNLNQFQFNIKVDRIDSIDSIDSIEKAKIIIDYKTGAINPKESLYDKDKLTDIQLPLYACFTHNDIKGVTYAQLKSNKPLLTGISANHLSRSIGFNPPANSPIDSWEKLKVMWSELLNETAEEYIKGYAAIKFKDIKKLEYCNVKSILRLPERTFQFEAKEKSK